MSARPGGGRRAAAAAALRDLNPGAFALVMATGIVSIGVHHRGLPALSAALLWLGAACYLLLLVLLAGRIVRFGARVRTDLADPARGFGFFTLVAATTVLGTRLALGGHHQAAAGLLVAGLTAWLLLGYAVPWATVLDRAHRPIIAEANGTWFIWAVATQSVAVLATMVESVVTGGRDELALLAVFAWSVGTFLYAAQGVFVAARLLLYPLRPADFTPSYWVAMGATAITVVAGARIVAMTDTPFTSAIRDYAIGISVAFWAFGTWLIPALIAVAWWRHRTHRVPLRYESSWWSIVFPLGMYGVAAHYLGASAQLRIIRLVGAYETWVALAAWALTFVAMLAHLRRSLL